MTDEAGNSTFDDHELSTEYWNWYGYPPYLYYPYGSTVSMTPPFLASQGPGASTSAVDSPACSTIQTSTHNEDASEDEYSDADSTSTDLPPSPEKVAAQLGHVRKHFWRAHATVSVI